MNGSAPTSNSNNPNQPSDVSEPSNDTNEFMQTSVDLKPDFFLRDGKMVGIKVKRSETVYLQKNSYLTQNKRAYVIFPYLPCCHQAREAKAS